MCVSFRKFNISDNLKSNFWIVTELISAIYIDEVVDEKAKAVVVDVGDDVEKKTVDTIKGRMKNI